MLLPRWSRLVLLLALVLGGGLFGVRSVGAESQPGFIRVWGSTGSGNGQFDAPYNVAVDSAGNIYVADSDNNRIQKFDRTGTFITKWGSFGIGIGQLSCPSGVAVDNRTTVYVADTCNHRIEKFTSTGTYLGQLGDSSPNPGDGDGQFYYPSGVAVDSNGNVYVADTSNNRIQKFDSYGHFLIKWGSFGISLGQFYSPVGVVVDSAGNIYVADTANNRIQEFGYSSFAADLSVNLAGPTSGTITRGGTLSYAIDVTNGGPDPATAVVLYNLIPANTTFQAVTAPSGWSCTTPAVGRTGPVTCTTPSLAVGGSASFSLTVSTPQGNISGLVFTDTAIVSSSTPDLRPANNSAIAETAATPPPAPGGGARADLVVNQTAAPPHGAKVGGTVTFRVKVTNTGPDTATGVHLTTILSGVGVTVRTEGRCGPPAGSTVSCDLGTLPNHASAVVTITAKPTAVGMLMSTATVTSSSTDPSPDNRVSTDVTITGR